MILRRGLDMVKTSSGILADHMESEPPKKGILGKQIRIIYSPEGYSSNSPAHSKKRSPIQEAI